MHQHSNIPLLIHHSNPVPCPCPFWPIRSQPIPSPTFAALGSLCVSPTPKVYKGVRRVYAQSHCFCPSLLQFLGVDSLHRVRLPNYRGQHHEIVRIKKERSLMQENLTGKNFHILPFSLAKTEPPIRNPVGNGPISGNFCPPKHTRKKFSILASSYI